VSHIKHTTGTHGVAGPRSYRPQIYQQYPTQYIWHINKQATTLLSALIQYE